MNASELPSLLHLATRLVLDQVSYSNPLPYWIDSFEFDYEAHAEALAPRLAAYFAGPRPAAVLELPVPTKANVLKPWRVPSVDDQIVLQVCASALADALASSLAAERVFSYRRNEDPGRLALCESPIRCWRTFQEETRRRLESSSHILQIDLENAFPSVDRDRFLEFLERTSPGGAEVAVLRHLLDSIASGGGLPLVNESLFFLGNAYFGVVDEVVARHAENFLRFVDDYRIFAGSKAELERVAEGVSRDLRPLGFRVNPRKLRLGSGDEYLGAVGGLRTAKTEEDADGYLSVVVFADVPAPEPFAEAVERVLSAPERHLTEGFGRFVLGALRRMRLNEEAAQLQSRESPRTRFLELLGERGLHERAWPLLERYAASAGEAWRAVWLLYLMVDLEPAPPAALEAVAASAPAPVVRLWARRLLGRNGPGPVTPENLFARGYLEAGEICHGGPEDA